MTRNVLILFALVVALPFVGQASAQPASPEKTFVNSLGMKMVCIPAGSFEMGSANGDFDERPVHKVAVGGPFFMAATEVTNAQYEQFDPEHKQCRGRRGLSQDDDEAVIFVSWREATAFCRWLSKKEGKPYRLPTEAEWEYACRAGTTTDYSTGATLPEAYCKNQTFSWDPQSVPLGVGRTPANAWGLHDMHGNVEEWCYDTYGPYPADAQTDPVGYDSGEMKVTRGGSHNTEVRFLRSANRLGTLPEDKHWLIGLRVVQAEPPHGRPLPPPQPGLWAQNVKQTSHDWHNAASRQPYFAGPEPYVHIPAGSNGPLFSQHNHCPSITWCINGDLLAVWFSTNTERGREMTIAASRRRAGSDRWDAAAEFFKAPDRNMTGSALFHDGQGKLYHFNGLEAGDGWANLALVLRTSTDNGVTWATRLIEPLHQPRNQVISGTSRTREGYLIQACDAVHSGNGGSAIHVSRDGGGAWVDPGAGTPMPDYQGREPGGTIAGIHAGVVSLSDGRLLAFGRGDERPARGNNARPNKGNKEGKAKEVGSKDKGSKDKGSKDSKSAANGELRMVQSISADLGKTWTYAASPWPPINGGQRLVLMRLREGPLLFVSFTDSSRNLKKPSGMELIDAAGRRQKGFGMFAALSLDEGKTWPVQRLITDGKPAHALDGGAWTRGFTMDPAHGEPKGYLAATQTPDGMVHLISSALYYRFNLAWLRAGDASTAARGPHASAGDTLIFVGRKSGQSPASVFQRKR